MSRIVVAAIAVCIAIPVCAKTTDTLETYQRLTSVEPRCTRPSNDRDIVVCGARRADRWRVPFIGYKPGDPRGETVSAERNRLASAPKLSCGIGAFLAGCGMVGVSVGTNFSPGGLRLRPLAP